MVGVATKSKACLNCRKRRVACGFERPQCLRCQKAGIDCLGYQRRALFVNRTVANPSLTAKDVIRTSSDLDEATQDVVDWYRDMSRAFASADYATGDFRSAALRILRRLYLPRKGSTDGSLAIGTTFWVATVCNCPQQSAALDHSLLALCAAQLYITRHGDVTLDEALEVYSSGLSRLSAGLQRVDPTTLACLLGSIVALSTCELFICPLTSGWRAHSQGMADLLRCRVDFNHQGAAAPAWTNLCARARVVSVLTGMMSQTRSSVTAAQWRAIMPEKPQDDPLDDLLDIISDLPSLFEQTDINGDTITSLLSILNMIYDWEQRFRKRIAPAPYSFVPSQLSNTADDGHDTKLYPLVLEFPALRFASCFIICWGATLQTLATITRLHNEGFEPTSLQPVWDFLDRKMFRHSSPETAMLVEAKRRAGMLCQCVEYTHREEMGSIGPQSMTYVRALLLRFFTEHGMTRELAWCRNIPHMKNDKGEKFAVQMLDFRA